MAYGDAHEIGRTGPNSVIVARIRGLEVLWLDGV